MRNSQKSDSKIPPHMVAWLSAEGWTAEELSFVEKYGRKIQIKAVEDLDRQSLEKVRKAKKVHDRLEKQVRDLDRRFRGSDREYDSKNNYQGKDSPEWFRASIDRNLFK